MDKPSGRKPGWRERLLVKWVESRLRRDPEMAAAAVPKQRDSMIAGLGDEALLQFYGAESDSGKGFRWSQPVCAVKVYPPRHSDRATLRLHPFAPPTAPPSLWLGGRPLVFLGQQGLRLEYQVPHRSIPPHPAWLVIVASPFHSQGDARSLGLPLHRIKFDSPRDAGAGKE